MSAHEAAELALARGDYERAALRFDRLVERDAADTRALLGSARAHLAAQRGESSVERFDAYRARGARWKKVQRFEYCTALDLATRQVLAERRRPERAFELAARLESEACANPRAARLLLRSRIAVADAARSAGENERALAIYLDIVATPGVRRTDTQRSVVAPAARGAERGTALDDSERARAYLGATDLLLATGRREQALAVLSQGLDELPGNRDLVHRMVTVLAEGTSLVFPRGKPPDPTSPAAPD